MCCASDKKREAAVSNFWKDPRAKAGCLAAGRALRHSRQPPSTMFAAEQLATLNTVDATGVVHKAFGVPKLTSSNIIEEDASFSEPLDEALPMAPPEEEPGGEAGDNQGMEAGVSC